MEITDIRHDWPEKAGFTLVRPTGIEIYTFLHFMNSVEIEINREKVTVRPGACIFYAPDEPQWFHSDSNLHAQLGAFCAWLSRAAFALSYSRKYTALPTCGRVYLRPFPKNGSCIFLQ